MSPNPPSSRWSRLRRGRAFVSLLVGYLAVPVLNAVSPLLALPAVTSTHGAGAWAAIALGQSLGGTAGVVIELGWGLSGTQRVARMSARNRARVFATSLVTKGAVAVPVLGVAVPLAAWLAPRFAALAALIAVATGLAVMGGGWIFIGMMRPRLFLLTEVLPRTALIAASATAITAGLSLFLYPIALLLAALISPTAAALALRVRISDLGALGPRRVARLIRLQGHALSTNIFSSMYLSLGTTIATLGSVNATALYASVDRLKRMVQQVISTQQYVLKGWVGREVDPARRIARAVRATVISAGIGVICGIGFAVSAPLAAELVFSGTVHVPPLAAALGGANLAVICASMASGPVLLVALGRIQAVARSAAAGAVVGLPSIFVGALLFQGTGALAGQLIAESVVLSVQLLAVRARLRTVRGPSAGGRPGAGAAQEASTASPE